jgi:aldehyde dehydrogenase (NAD+)
MRIANDTKYGLHACERDRHPARRVASRILAGRVAINGMLDGRDAPWDGFKYSGVGREFARYGMEAFPKRGPSTSDHFLRPAN